MEEQESEKDFFKEFQFSPVMKKNYMFTSKSDDTDSIEASEKPDEPMKVLEPDHPLLGRFQKVLKDHLLKQIERLRDDVGELDTGCKKKNLEREQLGVEAYETQQTVNKQQTDIDACVSELQTISAAREQIEYELQERNKIHKDEKNRLNETERKEIELRNEIESINMLVHQMSKWEEDIESELQINQRIAEKTRKDKIKLASEKKEQDLMIFKLMSEVWRLEGELETMVMQLRVKEEERENLAEAVALSNIDIEANEADHRCLMHGWQSVIVTITNRNKHYNSLLENYKKLEEKLTRVSIELVLVKKETNKELLKNETLTVFKDRVETDLKNTNRLYAVEMEKRDNFERLMAQYESIAEQLEKDLKRVNSENSYLTAQWNGLFKEVEKLNFKKYKIEEEMLKLLEDKITNTKASRHLDKMAKEVKESNRTLRIGISNLENRICKIEQDYLTQKLENSETGRQLEEIQKLMAKEDGELLAQVKESERCDAEMERKIRALEVLKSKLSKYEDDMNASKYLTPHELKIRSLEANIADTMERNKEMQSFWLREQTIVVDLAEKRQEQIRDINLLKKQIKIVDQKNLKITDELENYKNQEEVMTRSINTLQNKLAAYTDTLNKKKGSKDSLDAVNNITQVNLLTKLEDSEFESLKLKAEIVEIEEDKLTLSDELIEKNREALCWEKKTQMVLEAKKNMQKEMSEEGEIGKMKAEIHRMNVRYSHLKKAQEKLMNDLEHCVSRREAIVTIAEARTKFIKGGSQLMRINFSKKLDDIKNKLNHIENDRENIERRIEMKQYEVDRVEEEIEITQAEIGNLQKESNDILGFIDQKKIDKQLNLDILLFKQRKLKVYSELARGRLPYTPFKSESSAHMVYSREKELNSKLRVVVENLLKVFPQHIVFLTKSHNSLVLPALNL